MGNPPCKTPANHCTPQRHRQRHCIPAGRRQDQGPPEAPPEKSPARHRQSTQTQGTHKRNCDRCPPNRFDFTCEISSVTSSAGSRDPPRIHCTIQAIRPSFSVRLSQPLPPQVLSSMKEITKKRRKLPHAFSAFFHGVCLIFAPWRDVLHFQEFQNACLFLFVCLCLCLHRSFSSAHKKFKKLRQHMEKFWQTRQVTGFISQVR